MHRDAPKCTGSVPTIEPMKRARLPQDRFGPVRGYPPSRPREIVQNFRHSAEHAGIPGGILDVAGMINQGAGIGAASSKRHGRKDLKPKFRPPLTPNSRSNYFYPGT